MTEYFYVEPEVAGGLGDGTVMDSTVHPPIVSRLHFVFDGWLGDPLLTSFPVYLVTSSLKAGLIETGATGIDFDKVEVTTSPEFADLHPHLVLPTFEWLKPRGTPGHDDIAVTGDGRFVVSQHVLAELRLHGMKNAVIHNIEIDPQRIR